MANRSRAKGTNWEGEVVDFLRAHCCPHAERRTSNARNDRGDIVGIPGVVIEAKAAQKMELGSWLSELEVEIANDDAGTGALFVKRIGKAKGADGFIVMTPERWAELMRLAGWFA